MYPAIPKPTGVADEDLVHITVDLSELPRSRDVTYSIDGMLDHDGQELPRESRVEGTFSLRFYGRLSEPQEWLGFSATVDINNLGSQFRLEHEAKGVLGYGFAESNSVLFRLEVKPSIARDIAKILTRSPQPTPGDGTAFLFWARGMRASPNPRDERIVFDIVHAAPRCEMVL